MDIAKIDLDRDVVGFNVSTIEDCRHLYNRVELARKQFNNVADEYQGKALLEAKRIMFPDKWNDKSLNNEDSRKWVEFCDNLKASKQQVQKLLDFAGYKEAEAEHIKAGEDVIVITNASHFREVKKLTDNKEYVEVIEDLAKAVKDNDGEIPTTAKEVKKVMQESKGIKQIAKEDWDKDEEKKKPEPKNMVEAKERIRVLKEDNAELKARNKELEKKLKDFNLHDELRSIIKGVILYLNPIVFEDDIKEDMKRKIGNIHGLENALRVLWLTTTKLPTAQELKRNYKDSAKKAHPDKGGTDEEFQQVSEAYKLVSKAIKGNK